MTIGEKIKYCRKQIGITQDKLAELTGKGELGTDTNKVEFTGNKVSKLVYTHNGVTCTYNGSTYECAK